MLSSNNRSIIYKLLILVLVLAVTFTFSACGGNNAQPDPAQEQETEPAAEPQPAPEPEPVVEEPEPDPIINLLTGKRGDKEDILKTRIIGIVVENHPAARPQWGMDDKKYSPDIILEGEVEGGITRMLWLYADFKHLPETIGPIRSARPPFIKFSELYNAIFVHWGMSHTEEGYTGADSVFRDDDVPHLNGMYYEGKAPFHRMYGTGRAVEHTGIITGSELPKELKRRFATKLRKKTVSQFKFYETKKARGKKNSCYQLTLKFSKIGGQTNWKYNSKKKKYYSDSFNNNVSRDNLLVLFDKTNYITKPGYTTYCNYKLGGGTAYYASCGSYQKVKWRVKDGKLWIYKKVKVKNDDGTEKTVKRTVKLNPGKTWIGWASSNYDGKCTIKSKAKMD